MNKETQFLNYRDENVDMVDYNENFEQDLTIDDFIKEDNDNIQFNLKYNNSEQFDKIISTEEYESQLNKSLLEAYTKESKESKKIEIDEIYSNVDIEKEEEIILNNPTKNIDPKFEERLKELDEIYKKQDEKITEIIESVENMKLDDKPTPFNKDGLEDEFIDFLKNNENVLSFNKYEIILKQDVDIVEFCNSCKFDITLNLINEVK